MSRPKITLEDMFDLTGSEIFNPDTFIATSNVSTDTRTIVRNSVFIALKGEKFDGHNFVDAAISKGASAVVINRNKLKKFDHLDVTIITVPDTTTAYGELATAYRKKLSAKVVAITGSNGKTTTKEILSSLLSEKFKVTKTLSNNNNHIGVPLTIFSADMKTDILVLELGTNHFGEIKYTAHIAQPDYSVITNIGQSHLEYLKDLEGVAGEKMALFEETEACGGKLFVNNDDTLIKEKTRKMKDKTTFGLKGRCDIRGSIKGVGKNGETILNIATSKKNFDIKVPLLGQTNAQNFLTAAAIALELGLSKTDIIKAASKLTAVDKRLNLVSYNSFELINDTYNSNPESMRSAFRFMKAYAGKRRKIAVLGDMFELGDETERIHREMAHEVITNGISEIYTTGKMMALLNEELVNAGKNAVHFRNRRSLASFLSRLDKSDSLVLLKGSRGMKMEEFIPYIGQQPDNYRQ